MTCEEFNIKYKDYIENRFNGLEFDIPEVTLYLDRVFKFWIEKKGFKFSTIKLKFDMARVYAECDKSEGSLDTGVVEDHINYLVIKSDLIEAKKIIKELREELLSKNQ